MNVSSSLIAAGVVACLGIAAVSDADAGARGRAGGAARSSVHAPAGGGASAGGGARQPVNHPNNRQAAGGQAGGAQRDVNRNANVNRNTNISNNTNVNVDRDVNIDVDNGWDNHWDHPVAAAAVTTAAIATTAAAIGSIAYSVPPSCVTTVVNGVAYQQCGSTWYQPQYVGSSVQYIVVSPP